MVFSYKNKNITYYSHLDLRNCLGIDMKFKLQHATTSEYKIVNALDLVVADEPRLCAWDCNTQPVCVVCDTDKGYPLANTCSKIPTPNGCCSKCSNVTPPPSPVYCNSQEAQLSKDNCLQAQCKSTLLNTELQYSNQTSILCIKPTLLECKVERFETNLDASNGNYCKWIDNSTKCCCSNEIVKGTCSTTPIPSTPTPPAPTPPTPIPSPRQTKGPGGTFPQAGLCIYYFIDNCPDNSITNIPQCLFDPDVKIILIAFANSFSNDMKEDSFGKHYEVAKYLRKQKYKGIIQFSLGGQTGMSDSNFFNFFNNLSSTTIPKLVDTIANWQYVDGLDFDIEPAEGGGTAFTTDIIKNKIVPLALQLKTNIKSPRPITTTCYGTYLNENAKIDMPRWFSNISGGVGADLVTSMTYNETVDIDIAYAINMTKAQTSVYTSMATRYPETLNLPLYNKNQVGVGLLGNIFGSELKTEYSKVTDKGLKFIAIWAMTPNGPANCIVANSSPSKCTKGSYSL